MSSVIKQGEIGSPRGQFAASHHLDALTLYAFSSENWNRPVQEVSALMELFVRALDSEVKACINITSGCG